MVISPARSRCISWLLSVALHLALPGGLLAQSPEVQGWGARGPGAEFGAGFRLTAMNAYTADYYETYDSPGSNGNWFAEEATRFAQSPGLDLFVEWPMSSRTELGLGLRADVYQHAIGDSEGTVLQGGTRFKLHLAPGSAWAPYLLAFLGTSVVLGDPDFFREDDRGAAVIGHLGYAVALGWQKRDGDGLPTWYIETGLEWNRLKGGDEDEDLHYYDEDPDTTIRMRSFTVTIGRVFP